MRKGSVFPGMQFFLAGFLLSVQPDPASTSEQCGGARDDLLAIRNWAISISRTPYGLETAEVTITYESRFKKPIKRLDARIFFKNSRGETVEHIALEKEVDIDPGETHTEQSTFMDTKLDRVAAMAPEDVFVISCVEAVGYADGTNDIIK